MRYKFRAEFFADVQDFLDITVTSTWKSIKPVKGLPDVEVIIESDNEIQDIIDEMKTLIDSHVMWQTISLKEHYTGERYPNR